VAEPVLSLSESVHVDAPPEQVYDLVSDVTRTGEWSPVCQACWWDEGAGPVAGAWFTGRNQTPTRTWETRSQVEVATRPTEFAWTVGQGWVRWAYTLAPEDGGTRLTESWQFLPAGLARFRERYGADADAQIAERSAAAVSGVPATLAALKRIAEAG
jgi:hypothetical protein